MTTKLGQDNVDFTLLQHAQETLKNLLPIKRYEPSKSLTFNSRDRQLPHTRSAVAPLLLLQIQCVRRPWKAKDLIYMLTKSQSWNRFWPCAIVLQTSAPPFGGGKTPLHPNSYNFFSIASNLTCEMFLKRRQCDLHHPQISTQNLLRFERSCPPKLLFLTCAAADPMSTSTATTFSIFTQIT